MRLRTLVISAAVLFTLSALAPQALGATAFSNWKFIHKSNASCGYFRDHVDNSQYIAVATTKNTELELDGTCTGASDNPEQSLPTGYLEVQVELIDDTTNYACGSAGPVYSGPGASVSVTANYIAQTGCRKHAGDGFYAAGSGAKWDGGDNVYYSSGAVHSPDLNFN